jgi:hypothetical protein
MEVMSREEWREFVLAGTRTAKAGFTRGRHAGGYPGLDNARWGGRGVHHAGGSLKHKALLRDPRITLCIDDQEPPYSYVMITGQATRPRHASQSGRLQRHRRLTAEAGTNRLSQRRSGTARVHGLPAAAAELVSLD